MSTDWRLGLVGRNGRGKTTLMRLLAESKATMIFVEHDHAFAERIAGKIVCLP